MTEKQKTGVNIKLDTDIKDGERETSKQPPLAQNQTSLTP